MHRGRFLWQHRLTLGDSLGFGLAVLLIGLGVFARPGFGPLEAAVVGIVLLLIAACYLSSIPLQSDRLNPRVALAANDVRLPSYACFLASLLLLPKLSRTFFWVDLLLAALCVWVACRRRRPRFVLVNATAVFLTLAAAEARIGRYGEPTFTQTVLEPRDATWFMRDPLLGDVPRPNVRAVLKQFRSNGSEEFRATCSIDEHGLRVTPRRRAAASVACLGCSFTFGNWANDEETMPYRLGVLRPEYQVLNFGISGAGPHQMLALMESGRIERALSAPPKFVIFQVIHDHVLRVVNRANFKVHSPSYSIVDGRPHQFGFYDDPWPSLFVRQNLRSSLVYRRLIEPRLWTAGDVDLTVAILIRLQELFKDRFPESEFHVLYWDVPGRLPEDLLRQMRRASLKLHLMSEILPNYGTDGESYRLLYDGHPKPSAYDGIARYVSETIIGPRGSYEQVTLLPSDPRGDDATAEWPTSRER